MKKEELRLIFMGTADFAVPALRALVENGYQVKAVVTMPDKPMGRGHKVSPSMVKLYAQELGLPILQPDNLNEESFLDELRTYQPHLQIVVAFRMLPRSVWQMPPMGTINLHGSLLPMYRGAAPINHAIRHGDTETGVTTFRLRHEIDTGEVLLQEKLPIGHEETFGELYERMATLGASVLVRTVDLFLEGEPVSIPQEQLPGYVGARPAPKIFKDDCRIDWDKPAEEVHNFIRSISPAPTAWTKLHRPGMESIVLKIYRTQVIEREPRHRGRFGSIIWDKKNLDVMTRKGVIRILSLQMPGKKQMDAASFLNGFALSSDMYIE
ncbi:methionyl-tRNA formyltransferase [Porphyromonas gingivalis]|uniref:methionyl-tRNA formyltransferase n=1 Tax=Porphyromonas gingivalis TaxID=837 RepID=UPI00036A951E|nr:methionyl-tRNA formyltransferase [Porphyromonas gingivalis]EOA11150.1 methionyl-tRNA formyltransferase [Porphyromonas gingivalis JCVI SC001]PDP56191.1 methionyl-tRNA formyltransferase [Porphyromonas gingivalis]